MIENEQQYDVTKAQIQRFEETLVNFANDAEDKRQENPLLFETQVSALESQLLDLREELAEYEAQTAYSNEKPLLIKTNISEKTKTIEQVIQNIVDKILTNFIITSLIIGGLIFLAYFHSIGYVPELEINSVATLFGASAITGGIIYVLISVVLISPGIFYALYSKIAEKLLVNDKNKVKGFSRLSFATSILFFNYIILSQDNNVLWIIGKISCIVISLTIEFFICKSFYKKEIHFFRYFILPVIAYVIFVLLLLVIITLIYFVFISSKTGEIKNLFPYLHSPEFVANIAYLFLIISVVNKLVSIEADLGQNPSKLAKYLALSLIAFIHITIQFGVGEVIPGNIFNMYGWGNIKNASLVVNYEGCQILKKTNVKIIEEKCSKTKDFYQINDLQILSTIGKNYYLRYPKVHIPKKNNSKSISQKKNPKLMAKENSPKPKNSSRTEVAQPQKFVDFTFPASSIKSWSRK